jgi:hypothetical protein
MDTTPARLRCPVCGEAAGVPIVWGFPTPDVVEKMEAGQWDVDVVLGGCVVPDPFVNVACRACRARWFQEETGVDEAP